MPNLKVNKVGENRNDKTKLKPQHIESLAEFLLGCKQYSVATLYKRINQWTLFKKV